MKIFFNHCPPIVSWKIFGSVDQIEENRETLDLRLNYETTLYPYGYTLPQLKLVCQEQNIIILKGGIGVLIHISRFMPSSSLELYQSYYKKNKY
ncbi:unnamed protein product [Macrosiphum euphorbiae]|uniref:Uncharacterized protein n=1 Tax=Macrosiphum euphorbiae TaxID=13131 RepID=A0AAV0VVK3_9HEMI|nr:unnamed protein product [Macrosiphum euphorbiae]